MTFWQQVYCESYYRMVERLGGIVAGCAFLVELDGLNGRKALEGYDTKVLMNFPG